MAGKLGSKKYGGRVAGTPNKSTQELIDIAKRNDCDPFEVLIWFAKGDYEALGYEKYTVKGSGDYMTTELTISPELRQKSARDACEYMHSRRKAVDHSGSIDGIQKVVSLEQFIKLESENLEKGK